jgi:hypothetical protein
MPITAKVDDPVRLKHVAVKAPLHMHSTTEHKHGVGKNKKHFQTDYNNLDLQESNMAS